MAKWQKQEWQQQYIRVLFSHTSKQVIFYKPNSKFAQNLNENDILLLLHMESQFRH